MSELVCLVKGINYDELYIAPPYSVKKGDWFLVGKGPRTDCKDTIIYSVALATTTVLKNGNEYNFILEALRKKEPDGKIDAIIYFSNLKYEEDESEDTKDA